MRRAEAVATCYRLILDGNTRPAVIEAIEEWRATKLLRTPAKAVWRQAAKRFEDIALDNDQQRLGFCIAATLDLYRRMLANDDYSAALRAIEKLGKLVDASGTQLAAPQGEPAGTDHHAAPAGEAEEGGEKDLAARLRLIQGGANGA